MDSSLSDLRVAQGVALPFCPSLVRLLRLLQDFLFAEGTDNHLLWSEKVSDKTHPRLPLKKKKGLVAETHPLHARNMRPLFLFFISQKEAGVRLLSVCLWTRHPSKSGHSFVFYKYRTHRQKLHYRTVTHPVLLDQHTFFQQLFL